MGLFLKSMAVSFLLLALLVLPAGSAGVKPLEVSSERMLILAVERYAGEHAASSELVRKAVEQLNQELNITSPERTLESLQLLAAARETMAVAMRSSAALSGYVATSSEQLQRAGYGKFLPLARLDREIEKPYHEGLDSFLAAAADFVRYCSGNFEAITTGQAAATRQYEKLYAAYLQQMESFNTLSTKRSRQIREWSIVYPAIAELLPQ